MTEIVIYDTMPDFVKGLMIYISNHNDRQTEVAGFWEQEKFENHIENHRADILLVPTGYEVKNGKEKCVYVTEAQGSEGIYKYSAADEIIREMFSKYDRQAQICHTDRKVSLVAVYSADKNIYQTPFALTMAMTLAQTDRILYINLCENAGFEGIMKIRFDRDVSDFIYSLGHYTGSMDNLVASMAYVTNGFSYLPPMQNSADLFMLGKDEWLMFAKKLETLGTFDRVILDMGCMFPGFYEILKMCNRIYLPYVSNLYNKARCARFEETLENGGYTMLPIKKLIMPDMNNIFFDSDMLTCWQWGDMGDFVRSVLKKEDNK